VNIAQRRIRTEQIRPELIQPQLLPQPKRGKRLLPSRKGTRWDQVLFVLVAYRLLAPGSEWRLHREWYERSALRQPTRTPLPGPAQPQLTKPQPHHRRIRHDPLTPIFGE